MKNVLKNLLVGSLLLFGAGACADLEITNYNDPDAGRTLATAGDVVSLISGAYNTLFRVHNSYYGAGMAFNNAAFTYTSPWANCGQEKYGRLPRISFINDIADNEYDYMNYTWFRSYRAIAGAADGLRSLADPDIQAELTADDLAMAQAFGKFVLGYGHATVAAVYDRGFVVDETTDLAAAQEPIAYNDLMDVAMDYFDDAIALSTGGWSLPMEWLQAEVTAAEFVQVIHSFKARYEIARARTAAERAALNWNAIIAEVDAGVTEDFVPFYDDWGGWSMDVLGIGTDYGWAQMGYWIWGMADQEGDYQAWLALTNSNKYNDLPSGDPVLIVTPDTRFPQGNTVAAQRASQGSYFRIVTDATAGETWARADRGTWRWSYYDNYNGEQYWYGDESDYYQPEFKISEMNLIKAEGLMNTGNPGGAATLINLTRTAAGLNATDAAGLNTDCVPKLPDGTCGDLMEMLKWEKRTENALKGPLSAGWYFDSRGWGDLYMNTFTSLPIPCGEIQTLQMLPCETNFGGPGADVVYAAPMSSYQFPHEGG